MELSPAHVYVLAIILVYVLGHFAYMGLWRYVTAPDFDVNDFKAYYTAATAVRTGQADEFLYSDPERLNLGLLPDQPWVAWAVERGIPHPSAYIYPPFLAVVLSPLTLLSYHAANLAWFGFNVALLAASVLMLVRMGLKGVPNEIRALTAVLVVFVCLNFYPTLRAIQCGQVGFVLLFLTAGALTALSAGTRRGEMLAGLCLAVGTAIKLTPVILLVYLAFAGRRRAAAWGAGFLGVLTLLSVAAAGWDNHVLFVTGFLPNLSAGAATYANQSINGFLNRMFTDASMSVFDFSSEPAIVWWLTRLLGLALLGAAFLLAARRWRSDEGMAMGYGLIVLCSVMVSPIAWEHHYVLALIPLTLMIREIAVTPWFTTIVLVSAAYTMMAVDAFELIRTRIPRGARPAMSYVLYGGAILWLLIAATLTRKPASAPSPSNARTG